MWGGSAKCLLAGSLTVLSLRRVWFALSVVETAVARFCPSPEGDEGSVRAGAREKGLAVGADGMAGG